MKPLPAQTEPLTVVMRVRPMNNKEFKSEAKCIVYPVDEKFIVLRDPNEDSDDILRANRSREKRYIFDHVFSAETSQKEVYETVVEEKNIIDTVLSGYNCTVFAYGATGTGKTHTMLGSDEDPGIMVHTLNSLFRRMEETSEDKIYTVSIGYLEIYNENVRDLLCPDSGSLELREDANGSIVISNLLDISAESTEVVLGMLRMGNTNRTSEPTVANATSSRSHAILKVNVERRSRASNVMQESHCGSLYMVDLAGSERAAVTQNRGKRLIEGAHINRSLLALANCINALGSNGSNYINYRDSKLTRILKEALGGNCKTVMIAHVSPASTSYEETRNTMLYAERTKKIKNKARQNVVDVNHHVTQYINIIGELNLQIARLKSELNKAELGAAQPESEEVTTLCERLKSLITDQRILRQQLLDVEVSMVQNTVECQQLHAVIQDWEQKRSDFNLATLTAPSSTAPSPSPTSQPDSPVIDNTDVAPLASQYETLPIPVDSDTGTTDCSEQQHHSVHVQSPHEANFEPLQVSTSHSFQESSPKPNSFSIKEGPNSQKELGDSSKLDSRKHNNSFVKPRHILPDGQLLVPLSPELDAEYTMVVAGEQEDHSNAEGIHETVTLKNMSEEPDDGLTDGNAEEVTVETSEEVTVVEPTEVQRAREELIMLENKKEKMEMHYKILQKKLSLTRGSIDEIKEDLATADGFLPMRKEIVELLLSTSDLEASSMQSSLSTTLLRAHFVQQTSLIQQLLQHSATLLSLLERQRSLLEKGRMMDVSRRETKDLDQRLSEASEKQRRLATQVSEFSSTKSFGLPADLTEGYKCPLNEDNKGTLSLVSLTATSDLRLPDIMPPRASFSKKKYSVESTTSCFPLPSIIAKENSFMTTAVSTSGKHYFIEKKQTASNHSSPLKRSEIDEIVEKAKRNRDKKNASVPGEKAKRSSKQLPEKIILPQRGDKHMQPQRSDRPMQPHRSLNKKPHRVKPQQVVTRSLVIGQPGPLSSVVIDLESNDASAALTSDSRTHLHQTDSTESLLHGRKSQSHSNLSVLPTPVPRRSLLPVSVMDSEKSKKRKAHGRVGSVSSSHSVPGVTISKKKSVLDTKKLGPTSSHDSASQMDKEWARKTKYWGTSSKPLVKKIAFSNRPDSEISPHPLNSSSGVVDSDTNSTSDRGVTTDDSTTDARQPPKQRQKLQQRASLPNRQSWKNRRRHGNLQHSSQFTRTKNPFPSRKQLSLAKGSQLSTHESPYLNPFPNANKTTGSTVEQVHSTPSRKPLVRKRFPMDSNIK